MSDNVFKVLRDQLKNEIELVSSHMMQGRTADYPEYRENVGIIRGVRAAIKIVEDMERNYSGDLEDDE